MKKENLSSDPVPTPFPHIQEHDKFPLLCFLMKDTSLKKYGIKLI